VLILYALNAGLIRAVLKVVLAVLKNIGHILYNLRDVILRILKLSKQL
jgi:hypothetical protein